VIEPCFGGKIWTQRAVLSSEAGAIARAAPRRRRPFLFGALPLLAVTFVLLWNPPAELSATATIFWVVFLLFGFFTGFALYAIPHAALGAEVSSDSHERTRLFAVKQISFTLGILLAFAGMQQAMNAAVPRQTTAAMALPTALIAIALLAVTPLLLRESQRQHDVTQGWFAGLRDVWGNGAARTLIIVWFVENVGVGAVGTMAPYVAQYLFNRPDVVGALSASYVVAGVVAIPLWVRASRHFGARDTWLLGMLLAALAFGGMMFVGRENLTTQFVLLAIAGAAMGCGNVLAWSLLADIIDLDERNSGQRREGMYSAAMIFAMKVGNSLAIAGSGVVLGAVAFTPNAEQTVESLWGMRFLFAGLPCLGFILGAVLFRSFPLGRVAPRVALVGAGD
jgi:GPH family glycoside/pentoside/hexuronide:cation symporter